MPTSNFETGDHNPNVVETPVHPFASFNWRTILLVLALTFLALGLRLYHLSSQSLWIDEVYSVVTAKISMDQIYYYSTKFSNSLPTYFLLLKIALASNTDTEYNARLLSALAGGLSVPVFIGVVYCWRRHIGTALLAGLLLAVNPLHIWYSQEARAYTLMLFFGLLAILFLELALFSGRSEWLTLYLFSAIASRSPSPLRLRIRRPVHCVAYTVSLPTRQTGYSNHQATAGASSNRDCRTVADARQVISASRRISPRRFGPPVRLHIHDFSRWLLLWTFVDRNSELRPIGSRGAELASGRCAARGPGFDCGDLQTELAQAGSHEGDCVVGGWNRDCGRLLDGLWISFQRSLRSAIPVWISSIDRGFGCELAGAAAVGSVDHSCGAGHCSFGGRAMVLQPKLPQARCPGGGEMARGQQGSHKDLGSISHLPGRAATGVSPRRRAKTRNDIHRHEFLPPGSRCPDPHPPGSIASAGKTNQFLPAGCR